MNAAPRRWIGAIAATAAIAGFSGSIRSQTADAVALSVDDPRPVEAAVLVLIRKYAVSITYEDPRYECSRDLRDTTRSAVAPQVRDIIPIGGVLQATYEVSRQTGELADPAEAISAIVDAQNASPTGGRFAVYPRGETFHIVPTAVRGRNCAWIKQRSLLDTPITLSGSADEDGDHLLEAILKEVGAANGQTLLIGLLPSSLGPVGAYDAKIDIEAKGEPARDVLTRFLHAIGPRLTWVLNYSPADHCYYFNVLASAARSEPQPVRKLTLPEPGEPRPALRRAIPGTTER